MKTRSKQNWLLTAWCSVLLLFGCTLAGLAQQNQGFVPIGFLQPAGSGTSNPVTAAQGGTGSAANTGATGKILRGNGSGAYVDTPYTVPGTAGSANTILTWDGTNLQTSGVAFPNLAAPPSTGKVLVGNGINYTLSTPTLPITSSPSSGKVMIGDGTNWVSSTPTFPTSAGSSGNIITSDGTNFSSSAPSFNASAITAGTLALARGGLNADMASGAASGCFPRYNGSGYVPSTLTLPNASSTGQVMIGGSSNAIQMSTATYPNTVSGAGKIIRASGADAFSTSTATYPDTAGTSGNVLTSDGTNFVSSAPATGGGLDVTSTTLRSSKRFEIGNTAATTFTQVGANVTVTINADGGSASAGNDATYGSTIKCTTNTTGNQDAGWETTANVFTLDDIRDTKVYFKACPLSNSPNGTRIIIGVSSNPGTSYGAADATVHHAVFRYDTGASDTNWKTITNDNSGGGQIVDTGVAYTSIDNQPNVFAIDLSTPTAIKFYINGTLVSTHDSSNDPTTGTAMGLVCVDRHLSGGGAGDAFYVGTCYVEEW